jgi:hypothetical protein
MFDDDSTKRIYVPFIDSVNNPHNFIPPSGPATILHNNDSISGLVHIIVDSDYNIISAKPVFSHVDNPQVFYHRASRNNQDILIHRVNILGQNITIDNEDNIYFRANLQTHDMSLIRAFQLGSTYLDSTGGYTPYHQPTPVDYPYHIYLDSVHYITVENLQASQCIPFIIKYDSQGNILWCNQLYADRQDSVALEEMDCRMSVAVDSHYVYVPWFVANCWTNKFELGINISDSANWWLIPPDTLFHKDYFFDEEHYVGTAITNAYDVVVSPYEAILRNDPITFKLKQTPPGWHIRDWAVCTKGDLAARSLDKGLKPFSVGEIGLGQYQKPQFVAAKITDIGIP